jgi:hypothetical protein
MARCKKWPTPGDRAALTQMLTPRRTFSDLKFWLSQRSLPYSVVTSTRRARAGIVDYASVLSARAMKPSGCPSPSTANLCALTACADNRRYDSYRHRRSGHAEQAGKACWFNAATTETPVTAV